MLTKKDNLKIKLSGYSLIEVLITLAIFGVLSAMLGQALLSNLTLSARVSARTQVRTNIDQSMSLIERDFRNADWLTSTQACGGTPVTLYPGCNSSCSMSINGKIVVWCFQKPIGADPTAQSYIKGKLVRYETDVAGFQNDAILDITNLDFSVNNSQVDNKVGQLAYANILVTLHAQNVPLKITNQVKQISITTRNYSIK